jgi:hypothetical protein
MRRAPLLIRSPSQQAIPYRALLPVSFSWSTS